MAHGAPVSRRRHVSVAVDCGGKGSTGEVMNFVAASQERSTDLRRRRTVLPRGQGRSRGVFGLRWADFFSLTVCEIKSLTRKPGVALPRRTYSGLAFVAV